MGVTAERSKNESSRELLDLLQALNETVLAAEAFFLKVDQDLFDGHQTAREVLSHLVFWHREYALVIRALGNGRLPELKSGTYVELNAAATREFCNVPMPELAHQLRLFQDQLVIELNLLSNWEVNCPMKCGCRSKSVADRLPTIESHIHNHVTRLKRAERLGEAWVEAYYSMG